MSRKKNPAKLKEKVFMKKNSDSPKELEQNISELTDLLKRTQADFINYRDRVERDNKQFMDYSKAELVKKLLPVLDSFELALKNTRDPEKFKQGIEMVYAQFLDALKSEGLIKIKCEHLKFDPYKHEVLLKVKSEEEEDTILEELQKGYLFKDKVLRHAKVKVSGGKC